jgi:methyl-accepting chemotaxis protein
VVAAEVRALAQHSAEAAREIKGLIQASADQVGGGVKLVRETSEALERIVTRVSGMETLLFEVAGSSREQTTAVAEVSTTIQQMDQVTHQNAAMAEHSSAAARGLRADMTELTSLLSRFRLDGGPGEARRAA